MGLFEKILDVTLDVQSKLTTAAWNAEITVDELMTKKDKYHNLKKNKEYVEDDVKSIESELRKANVLTLARLYCIAYIGGWGSYMYGDWQIGDEDNFLDCLEDDVHTKNKLKKLLVDYFFDEHGGFRHYEDGKDFEKARMYIDLLDSEEECSLILDDIKKLSLDSDKYKSEQVSRVRTYIKKKTSVLNGDNEGDESLAKTLDDLI